MIQKSGLFTIKDLIFNANQDPDHNAIESPGYQPLTYKDLRHQVLYVVKTLNALGFHRNDRLGVISPAGPETAVIIISVMAGFTAVPLNPQNKKQEYERYFSQLKIKAVIVQKGCETAATVVAESQNIPIIELLPIPGKAGTFELKANVAQNIKEPEFATPSDIAYVFMTSGTTARPKIVPISQKKTSISQQRSCGTLKITHTDRCLHIVPYYHGMGIGPPLLSVLFAGGTVICTKEFIPSDFLSLLKTFRPTYYSAGPALHQGILREIKKVPPDELKNNSLRFIRSGSASLPPTTHDDLETLLGVPVIEAFAMSEAGIISVNFPQKRGSVGIPIIDSLKIINDIGSSLGTYEQGEIVVKGETVFSGYEDSPEENKAAFIDGWFKTGDIGYLDDEGYLFYTGRKKELINKGGEKISPAEIDNVLMTHPSIKQAMAFRINDPVLGEDIAAMVVMENQKVSEEELRKYLIDRLIQFKVPKRIYVVDEIPKGPTGKLLRYVGTERYKDGKFEDEKVLGQTNDTISPELSLCQEKLLQIWKDILDIESLSPDDDFFQSGGNSLAAIELLISVQRMFHINFPADTIYRYPTIRDQALLIIKKCGTTVQEHPLIVPIRREGNLPPLFCIHPVGGWVSDYISLSRFMNQQRPIFGIRASGLEPTEIPSRSVEEAAQEYIQAIKTVQKNSPYYLLGFSGGGIFAFELASQLIKRGDSVAFLGIIDISAPRPQVRALRSLMSIISPKQSAFTIPAGVSHFFRFIDGRLRKNPDSILYSLFVRGIRASSLVVVELSGSKSNPSSLPDILHDERVEEFFLANVDVPKELHPLVRKIHHATFNYLPHTYSGDITFFSTQPDPVNFPGDPTRGWNSFTTGKTVVFDIPGDHETLFHEPHCQIVAQKIEQSLEMVEEHGQYP